MNPLSDEQRQGFLELEVFPERADIPLESVVVVWSRVTACIVAGGGQTIVAGDALEQAGAVYMIATTRKLGRHHGQAAMALILGLSARQS
jgi:hypothetical protein